MSVNHKSDPPADLLSGGHQDPRPVQPPPGLTQFLDAVTPAGVNKAVRAGLLVAASAFAIAYGLYWWQFHMEGLSNQQDVWGQFGDFIGGTVNPVLSFLSLGALVFTVWLQMRQLELSREALLATQREMREAAKERDEATKALKDQLEQARLTAQAQTAAAEHQLATAKAMHKQAEYAGLTVRIQALGATLEALAGGNGMNPLEVLQAVRHSSRERYRTASDVQELRKAVLADLLALTVKVKDGPGSP